MPSPCARGGARGKHPGGPVTTTGLAGAGVQALDACTSRMAPCVAAMHAGRGFPCMHPDAHAVQDAAPAYFMILAAACPTPVYAVGDVPGPATAWQPGRGKGRGGACTPVYVRAVCMGWVKCQPRTPWWHMPYALRMGGEQCPDRHRSHSPGRARPPLLRCSPPPPPPPPADDAPGLGTAALCGPAVLWLFLQQLQLCRQPRTSCVGGQRHVVAVAVSRRPRAPARSGGSGKLNWYGSSPHGQNALPEAVRHAGLRLLRC